MEVSNPMMDQLLVNTASQPNARQNVRDAAKDADRPDFDSMVNQRRAADAKLGGKDAKAAKQPGREEPAAAADAAQDGDPVTGEQYAIAAALMMQAQPDGFRMAQIQPETVAAENTVTVEAVAFDNAPAAVGTVETQATPEIAAEPKAQQSASETPVDAEAFGARAEAERPVAPQSERPVETRGEAGPEAKGEAPEAAQAVKPEYTAQPEDAAQTHRAERPVESPGDAREARPEQTDETPDDAQAAQAAPLFERVDAPVIKVAEAPRPIPLEAENGMEQLGGEIGDIVVNNVGANRIEVTLTPENLGRLTVEVTRGTDGTLSVVLHTANERTASLLEKGADGLRQALATGTRSDVEVQVRPNEEPQQQFLNPNGQNGQNHQQQQQQQGRRHEQNSAQDFLQQLRLGLVDVDGNEQ